MRNIRQFEQGSPGFHSSLLQPQAGQRTRVFLLPGQLHASKDPAQIVTILGSCVAVCLWDRNLKIGGMNHFLLPELREGTNGTSRFGDIATRTLLEMLMGLGSRKRDIAAKVFGGASLFRNQDSTKESLGDKNVAAAMRMMKNANIEVIAKDIGGDKGRKLIFNTDDGEAWARYV
jgi:chemotaxis protein CheD